MIIIKDLNTNTNINFELTKFPDGTSQAWKLSPPPELMGKVEVLWMFENEAELFHILQIGDLLSTKFRVFPLLHCPWLPYARQDKAYGNNSTFAKRTFMELVRSVGYSGIKTFDAHSQSDFVISIEPQFFHKTVVTHDVIVYPDTGALTRYGKLQTNPHQYDFYCEKKRNQLSGEIEGLILVNGTDLTGASVVIIDDICDGGRTFLETVKALQPFNPESIDLVVSHGIFSKGLDVLFDGGIRNIYTTNSRMNMVHTGNLSYPGHSLTVYDVVDLQLNLDYNDLKRQEKKTL